MPVILSAPGTVEPLATVAIKPRVDGQIVEVAFSEGDLVQEGSVLFRLDDRMVKAQIAQAEANIAKDEASLRDAEATLARRQALIGKQVVTEAALDQARYAVEGLKASIAAGRALLDIAEDAARLSHHPRADHRPHGQPHGQAGRHRAGAGCRGAGHHQPDQADPGQLRRAAGRACAPCRRALASKATADIVVPGGKRTSVRGTIGFIDNQVDKHDRLDRRQAGFRECRRGALAGPVGGGRAHRRGQAQACCRCRRAPCCRRSRA